jgi:hypothetical protein
VSSIAAPSLAEFSRFSATRGVRLAGSAIVIALLSILLQVHLRTGDDVSWLITASEKALAGQIPYVDFFEPNPPASLMLYLPSVYLAHLFGVAPEFMVAFAGFAAVFISLALCAAILARARLLDEIGPLGAAVALATLMLLPGKAFDERDHLAAIAGLPFLALLAARATRTSLAWPLVVAAGIGAGAMASIKPPYALAALAPLPYLAWRIGLRPLFALYEYYVAAAIGLLYIAVVITLFPGFASNMLPMMTAIYLPVRESTVHLMFDIGPTLYYALLAAFALIARRRALEPAVAVPLIASLGALMCFFIQAKGWSYQLYPALAFLIIAMGNALGPRAADVRLIVASVSCCLCTAAITLALARAPLLLMAGSTIAFALLFGLAQRLWPVAAPRADGLPIPELLAANAFAVAFVMFYFEGLPQPVLERALTRLGPHPTVLAISESLALGHPLVREAGGVWVQSVPSLWVTGAALGLIRESGDDPELKRKLEPFIQWDHDRLVADIQRNKPDAILVGKIGTKLYDRLWADPEISAARADYQFYVANDDPDWPAALYVRKDLIGLRPGIDAGAANPPKL